MSGSNRPVRIIIPVSPLGRLGLEIVPSPAIVLPRDTPDRLASAILPIAVVFRHPSLWFMAFYYKCPLFRWLIARNPVVAYRRFRKRSPFTFLAPSLAISVRQWPLYPIVDRSILLMCP